MMRRLLLVGVLFVFEVSMGATQPAVVQVMVNVKSIFELRVDRNIIDFKTMLPGEVKRDMPNNEGLKVSIKSNNGRPWFLKVSDLGELTNGSDIIPNSRFSWYGYPSKVAAGVWMGNGENVFSLTPVLAYSSHVSEYNNNPAGTDLFFKFGLDVPAKQNSGVYRSVVAFTLTE